MLINSGSKHAHAACGAARRGAARAHTEWWVLCCTVHWPSPRSARSAPAVVASYVARPMSCCMLVRMHNVTITFVGQYLVRQAVRVPAGPVPDVESEEADSGITCARHATYNVSDATDNIQHDRSSMPYGARTRVEPHRKCVQQSDAAVAAVAGLGCAVVERRRVIRMTVWAMLASISQIILHPFYEPLLQAAALSAGQFDRYLLFTGKSSASLSSPCAPSSSHTLCPSA